VVSNRLRPRRRKVSSTRVGLANLAERVRLTTRDAMMWEESNGRFTVSVPLVPEHAAVRNEPGDA